MWKSTTNILITA
uniref:Uncharacterized protein n=1 Tax=Rhizophora mucronata TaxID=61149 RepID=A0A2P2PAN7_RHIMU